MLHHSPLAIHEAKSIAKDISYGTTGFSDYLNVPAQSDESAEVSAGIQIGSQPPLPHTVRYKSLLLATQPRHGREQAAARERERDTWDIKRGM